MESLYCEYLKSESLLGKAQNSEDRNILERILITKVNGFEFYEQLFKELREKKSNMKISEIQSILNGNEITEEEIFEIENHRNSVELHYGKFRMRISNVRFQILKEKASNEEILKSAMAFQSLLPGGQQWAIPYDIFAKYAENTDKELVEGFASPFNSQALRLGGKYCSISKHDIPLGSLGNFFDIDFNNKLVILNPPFIEFILKNTALHVIKNLGKNNTFIIYTPNWTDSEFYEILLEIPNIEIKKLRKNTYFYEDIVSGIKIRARYDSLVFIISDS